MSVPVYGSPLYFSPIDVDERIGRALVRMIFLKYGALDAGTYIDADALRAATSRTLADVETIATSLAHVTTLGRTYAWSVTSTLPDDGLNVIQPTDRPSGAGRWISAPFRDFRGPYQWHGLECVGLVDSAVPVEAKPNQPSLITLCKGKTPSVFVCFTGKTDREICDGEPGATMFSTLNYQIKVISKNWRGSPSARFGSEIPEEAALDPGASEIIGRIEWLLRGSQGLYGEVPGGGYAGALRLATSPWGDACRVIIGNHETASSFGNDLRLMDVLNVSIKLATERPNEVEDLTTVQAFALQLTQPQDDGSAVDIGPPSILFARAK